MGGDKAPYPSWPQDALERVRDIETRVQAMMMTVPAHASAYLSALNQSLAHQVGSIHATIASNESIDVFQATDVDAAQKHVVIDAVEKSLRGFDFRSVDTPDRIRCIHFLVGLMMGKHSACFDVPIWSGIDDVLVTPFRRELDAHDETSDAEQKKRKLPRSDALKRSVE